jgi:sigma-E factor negative regulatory protein RseA
MQNSEINAELREQLSALLDGELEREQALFLLKRMEHDQALQALWSRMCDGADCLRQEYVAAADFSTRVSSAIEQEIVPAQLRPQRSWRQHVLGLALAASAAFAVVMLLGDQQTAPAVMTAAPTQNPVSASEVTGAMQIASPVFNPASARFGDGVAPSEAPMLKLDQYLLRHSEAVGLGWEGPARPMVYPVSHADGLKTAQ